jgi:hypothetical protein
VGVANEDDEVAILLGNGDGTFKPAKTHPVSVSPIGVAVADFNGDGNRDLAVCGFTSTVTILAGNGDGTFQAATNFVAGSGSYGIIAVNVNAGTALDVVVANQFADTVSILTNTSQ